MEQRLARLETTVDCIQRDVRELTLNIQQLSKKVDDIARKQDAMEFDRDRMPEWIWHLLRGAVVLVAFIMALKA